MFEEERYGEESGQVDGQGQRKREEGMGGGLQRSE